MEFSIVILTQSAEKRAAWRNMSPVEQSNYFFSNVYRGNGDGGKGGRIGQDGLLERPAPTQQFRHGGAAPDTEWIGQMWKASQEATYMPTEAACPVCGAMAKKTSGGYTCRQEHERGYFSRVVNGWNCVFASGWVDFSK